MHDISQLIRDHEKLYDMANELVEVTASSEEKPIDAFALLRQLALTLDDHLAAERDFLSPAAGKQLAQKLGAELEAFEQEFRDLSAEWSTYLHEWTIENITVDWRNFDHATRWVMDRLCSRIERENDLLYPLALHYGHIRLRDPVSASENAVFRNQGADI